MKTCVKFVLVAIAFVLVVATVGNAWADPATFSFSPATVSELPSGETFTVDVLISDVSNLYGWQINVTFNPGILGVVRVREGPFLKNVNNTVWPKPVVNNGTGYVFASASLMPPYPSAGATGSGVLGNITFAVKSGGSSPLHFDEARTYLRTVISGNVQEIGNVVRQDGTYGSGGGGFGTIGGVPLVLVAGVAAAAVVVVAVSIVFLRRRREKPEGVVR